MIKAKNLRKEYNGYPALNSVSFEILREHGITALLGPNGAGKTTCLRLLTGFLNPTAGSIEIDGQELTDSNRNEIAQKLGYLPETTPLYPEMLVKEYLHFMGLAHGLPTQLISERMAEMIDAMKLSSHLLAPISALSKGFRQRVALAGTLIHRPKYIILDEPTSGLDPNQISGIRSLIKSLGKKYTLILSTHILQEVEELCDRVIIVHQGSVVADQNLRSLRKGKTYRLVAAGQDIIEKIEKISAVKGCRLAGASGNGRAQKTVRSGTFQSYIIEYDDKPEILFASIIKNKWQIREFQAVTRSLQDIFAELTKKVGSK